MPKRRARSYSVSSASSASSVSSKPSSTASRAPKRLRSSSTASSPEGSTSPSPKVLKIYIVQEKLDEKSVHELYDLVEQNNNPANVLALELCADPNEADVIITAIGMRKRLQRHVDWNIAKQKPVLKPNWLRESAKQGRPVACGDFAALRELHNETVAHCPDAAVDDVTSGESAASSQTSTAAKEAKSPAPPPAPSVKPTDPRVFKNWRSRYACERASPLVCPNQALAVELAVLNRAREMEGENMSALSYEKSVAIIKSYPYIITKETFNRDIVTLPGLGAKTLSKIKEFMENGCIEETRETQVSERFKALSAFNSVYGIGPTTARMLYERGLRTIEDLERYYDVTPNTIPSLLTPNGKTIPNPLTIPDPRMLGLSPTGGLSGGKNKGKGKGKQPQKLPDMSIQIALALREDFAVPILRAEVEEIYRVVMRELDAFQPGCMGTVVGGHRRGKQESNDVDIVISHGDVKKGAEIVKGLCARFTRHLHTKGMVTQVMHLSSFHAHNALRTGHWDSLEKALTVFKLPPDEKNPDERRLYRRVDLIFAIPEGYWTAVVGWSGSKLFERDLRLWAKTEKGMKFDSSGLTRRHDSKLFYPKSEEEVFSLLGLNWIDPTMRNANV
ncbi:DNA polymerase mu [Pholiota conissans]|uniref:DNA polymerase mu n=1 Tax=Pholiota conissans TaxID=109636 RepID=A0A9P5ZE52_9AGAR|nr:DNA polymerase mu [Pholiota conissans]